MCFLLGGSLNLQAQQATALLTGTLKDATGAVVLGAKITLKSKASFTPETPALQIAG